MKMKKLLAGVLSAAMVATMIPASMAFSSVSAEGEGNGLVASYDFTKGQTDGWRNVKGVSVTDAGIVTTWDTDGAYAIENPLAGKVTDGFTVVVTTSAGFNNPGTSLFSFSHAEIPRNDDRIASAGAFSVMSDYESMHLNPWDGEQNGYSDYFCEDNVVVEDTGTTFVLTGNANGGITLYKNGETVVSFADTAAILAAATGKDAEHPEYVKTVAYWINNMEYFNLGTSNYWTSEAKTYTSVAFYNEEMSADQVEALSIANALDLEVIGMQAGTINDTSAIRFVANMDSSAVDTNNASIVNVGWAWEMKAATADWGEYQSAQVTTVTSDSSLTSETGKYAYTLVCESDSAEDYYSAVPYVVIEVNGNNYTFCYNGRGASYVSNPSDLVYAPADFAEVSTQA